MIKKIQIFILFFVSFFLIFSSCDKTASTSIKKPQVIVSIPPYLYFVRKIAGDTLDVKSMVPPNSNPHLFEPTPHQTKIIANVEVWFKIGEAFENHFMTFINDHNKKIVISDLRDNVDLIPYENSCHCCHDHIDFKDVHIWTSPRLAKIQAQNIASTLKSRYPEYKKLYEDNLALFLEELDMLNKEIEIKLSAYAGSSFLISHPAFGYFCKDYKIKQIPIEYEGKDPTLKMLSNTYKEAQEKNIKKVFIQAQYNNLGAEFIAEKMGLPLNLIDPYSEDYVENLKKFVDMIIAK